VSELQRKWDGVYSDGLQQPVACQTLADNRFLLPKQGMGLDLACGVGGNALLLAELGLTTQAWDISGVALSLLQQNAHERRLDIATRQLEITAANLPEHSFDVIVVSRFLDRTLCNAIMDALKPQGLLFYQTFTRAKIDSLGPSNPDYLLDRNELLRLFVPLFLIHYQEHASAGELQIGNRNEACFIGQKP
jgi:SAM-dependent methyltransferase